MIKGIKQLHSDHTWFYENRMGLPGVFNYGQEHRSVSRLGVARVMISRSHEFTARM
ncbi:MAG: hypothetical protein ABSD59_17535 [Terracidiphilus sp.]